MEEKELIHSVSLETFSDGSMNMRMGGQLTYQTWQITKEAWELKGRFEMPTEPVKTLDFEGIRIEDVMCP